MKKKDNEMKTTTKVVSKGVPHQIACELVKRILSEITFHHDQLKVHAIELGVGWMVVISATRGDTPRIVGGRGMTFKAIDCLVGAIGNKYRMKIRAKLEEPTTGEQDRYERFKASEDWNRDGILKLLQDVCQQVFTHPIVDLSLADIDNQTSLVTVQVSRAEDRRLVEPVSKALEILFNAIGKANGRTIRLDIAIEGVDSSRDLAQIFD
jgi:predicted RNA-binding protein YlqC (UPF0109 family)